MDQPARRSYSVPTIMAHCIIKSQEADWRPIEIPAEGGFFDPNPPEDPRLLPVSGNCDGSPMLIIPAGAGEEGWALLARPGHTVFVNGEPTPAGMRLLRNRDEILVGGESLRRLFFCTDSLPEPRPLSPELADVICPRCQQPLSQPVTAADTPEDGGGATAEPLVIACGNCRAWYHYPECWEYEDSCVLCPAPTMSYRPWTPARLEKSA